MPIIHMSTGIRKGVIIEIDTNKIQENEVVFNTAIVNAFNRATNQNLSKEQIMKNHYVNTYTKINYNKDGKTFDLEDNMSVFSLGHKKENYIFVKEHISNAEIESKNYQRIVAIDFETANSSRASVCSIGFIVEEDGDIIHEEEVLVNPKVEFSNRCIKVHGIKPLDVVDAPTWDIAWKSVEKYITPYTLVIAHNLRSMELSCIRQECERYGIDVPKFAKERCNMAYDTLKIAREMIDKEEIENYRLSTLCKRFDIELNHHNALSDARACLELFHHLKGDYVLI